jgi:hypothetical protein
MLTHRGSRSLDSSIRRPHSVASGVRAALRLHKRVAHLLGAWTSQEFLHPFVNPLSGGSMTLAVVCACIIAGWTLSIPLRRTLGY